MVSSSAIEPCSRCGFVTGSETCRELFNDVGLRVRALAWTDSMKTWRLLHDVYFVQHEEEFCGRYKGLVMHLGGLCWALEHGGHELGYRALQRLVDRNPWKDEPYPPPPGIRRRVGRLRLPACATRRVQIG